MPTAYSALLLVSGVMMIALGVAVPTQTTRLGWLNIIVGVAFFGYGFYLLFLFQVGRDVVSYYVFVLPVILIFRTIQARKSLSNHRAAIRRATTAQRPLGAPLSPGTARSATGNDTLPTQS